MVRGEVGRGGDAGKMAKREVIFILTSSVAHHVFCGEGSVVGVVGEKVVKNIS